MQRFASPLFFIGLPGLSVVFRADVSRACPSAVVFLWRAEKARRLAVSARPGTLFGIAEVYADSYFCKGGFSERSCKRKDGCQAQEWFLQERENKFRIAGRMLCRGFLRKPEPANVS